MQEVAKLTRMAGGRPLAGNCSTRLPACAVSRRVLRSTVWNSSSTPAATDSGCSRLSLEPVCFTASLLFSGTPHPRSRILIDRSAAPG